MKKFSIGFVIVCTLFLSYRGFKSFFDYFDNFISKYDDTILYPILALLFTALFISAIVFYIIGIKNIINHIFNQTEIIKDYEYKNQKLRERLTYYANKELINGLIADLRKDMANNIFDSCKFISPEQIPSMIVDLSIDRAVFIKKVFKNDHFNTISLITAVFFFNRWFMQDILMNFYTVKETIKILEQSRNVLYKKLEITYKDCNPNVLEDIDKTLDSLNETCGSLSLDDLNSSAWNEYIAKHILKYANHQYNESYSSYAVPFIVEIFMFWKNNTENFVLTNYTFISH